MMSLRVHEWTEIDPQKIRVEIEKLLPKLIVDSDPLHCKLD